MDNKPLCGQATELGVAAGTVESVADESDDPKHAVIELIIAASSMSMPMPQPEPEPEPEQTPDTQEPEEQQDEGGVSPAVFRTRHRDHPVLRDMKTEAGSEAVLFDRGAVVRPTQIDLLSCRRGGWEWRRSRVVGRTAGAQQHPLCRHARPRRAVTRNGERWGVSRCSSSYAPACLSADGRVAVEEQEAAAVLGPRKRPFLLSSSRSLIRCLRLRRLGRGIVGRW